MALRRHEHFIAETAANAKIFSDLSVPGAISVASVVETAANTEYANPSRFRLRADNAQKGEAPPSGGASHEEGSSLFE